MLFFSRRFAWRARRGVKPMKPRNENRTAVNVVSPNAPQ
jgi:hypothetical protein